MSQVFLDGDILGFPLFVYDFLQNAKDAAVKDTLCKVCLLLHHLNKQMRLMWVTGMMYVSVDKLT